MASSVSKLSTLHRLAWTDGWIWTNGSASSRDVVCLGYGFIASTEIARALGCEMRWDERHLGSLAVDVSKTGATSIDGVSLWATVRRSRVPLRRWPKARLQG